MTLHDDLNRLGYAPMRRRLRAAEGVAWQALNIHPLDGETAAQVLARIRYVAERDCPELILRFEHNRQEILPRAESCGCDPDGDGYEADHCEEGDDLEYLCARQHLGFVCSDCVNEDGDGPSWRPDRYEWPCPTVARLDGVAVQR